MIKSMAFDWRLAGEKTYQELISQRRQVKIICLAIMSITTLSSVFLSPFVGDEVDWQVIWLIAKKYNKGEPLFFICYASSLCLTGLLISSVICISLYCVIHIDFQYQLLNSLICKLHTTSIYHLNDVRYQEKVSFHLECCISMHVGTKR
ncbi:hypothetical protein JTB14_004902 [Gonioctena quinquepunctata]|nr:hypothetical protein JTB14_004902 [Gonioctena quinquepunctata]